MNCWRNILPENQWTKKNSCGGNRRIQSVSVSGLIMAVKVNLGTDNSLKRSGQIHSNHPPGRTALNCAELCSKLSTQNQSQRLAYLRLYSGTLHLRDSEPGRERKTENYGNAYPSKGEIVRTEIAHAGEIVIVPCDSLRLNDVLGKQTAAAPRET